MNLETISNLQNTEFFTVAFLALMAIFSTGGILAVMTVDGGLKVSAIVALLGAVCFGAGWGIYTHEANRVAEAENTVVDGFAHEFGLKLDGPNLIQLKGIEAKEITQNVEMPDGSLKQVLFRVVNEEVLPYTLDSDGSWMPMPAVGGAE